MLFKNASALPALQLYMRLVSAKDRPLLEAYLRYINLLAYRGMRQKGRHPKSFNLLYRAVSRSWSSKTLLGFLQQEFIARNLSLSLLLEPLDGFEWLAKNKYQLTLIGATPILLQVIAPVSRLVAALNNQSPPFYQPFADLIFSYASLYIMYVPKTAGYLQACRITVGEEGLSRRLPFAASETRQILAVTSGFRFRCKIGYALAMFAALEEKHRRGTLQAGQHFNLFAKVKVFFKGLWYTLTIKNKIRGLNKL